ncbi:MAG: rod shape-determining protein MreD [Gammaproteobacteria bacterium]|nr:rod shape-determining protein MreD [Gammaproteobacteria bacterium]MCY4198496.1 rod shape-determining protein MreD [Gammaproteobacteria bacterium]MCY4276473.1 rod shape-determining protein MreD [Gammaproteobacteria bacterium]MCY4324118.1 rod shape-determining protein MreD [Gammaproteobacteria bacterium]
MQQDLVTPTFHLILSMVVGLFLYLVATRLSGGSEGLGAWLRVEWIPLLLFFWARQRPNWPPLWIPWLFGLFLDVLRGEPLGLNALCFLTFTWLLSTRHEWVRSLSLFEQCMALFLFLCAYIALTLGVLLVTGHNLGAWWWLSLLPALITAALWPLTSVLLLFVHGRAFNA